MPIPYNPGLRNLRDAAAQRAQRVADFKNSRDTLKSAQAKLQGEAARTVGRNIALKGGKQ